MVHRRPAQVFCFCIAAVVATSATSACSGTLEAPSEPVAQRQAHAHTSTESAADELDPAPPSATDDVFAGADDELPPIADDDAESSESAHAGSSESAHAGPTDPVAVPAPVAVANGDLTSKAVPTSAASVARPSYNHGVGFFVRDGKLYDSNGDEFRVRGVNKLHWDASSPGLLKSRANATRWTIDFKQSAEKNVALLLGAPGQGGTIAGQSVVIPGNWDGTCKDDPALFRQIVDTWLAQAASWQKLEKHMILNIANEWGPSDSTLWRDVYKEAIGKLRAAGYHATISVTAGGCGQDPAAIVKYGREIFESDPEQNVIFDQHIYGVYQDVAGAAPGKYDDQPELAEHFAALADTGLVVVVGEFGPGRDIGPSPTRIDPERVVELAERHGLGWLAWAWDDNNLAGGTSDDAGFGMSIKGAYESSADLTVFGRTVVEHPSWGLKALARSASIFH